MYCKDDDRRGSYEHTSFDFLSYTFRPRLSKNKYGKHFLNFTPAVSREAKTRMRREMRSWSVARRSDRAPHGPGRRRSPRQLQGWINYFGRFYKSMLYPVFRHFNDTLVRWAMRDGLSSRFGGDSSVGERDLDAGAAEVDHCDERVGGVESVCAV